MDTMRPGPRPRISVIIPVYNGERFIQKALQCVFNQESPAHEIIVVNDGSKDGSLAILEAFKDRIRLISIPNGGVSNARNVGMRASTGEYLAFLDADDIWFRNKLRVMGELITRNPDGDFFASDYVLRLAYHGNRMKKHSDLIGHQDKINYNAPLKVHPLHLLLGLGFTSTPSAIVVKKSAAEKIGGFDTQVRLIEDLNFYLRLALNARFVLSPDILLYKYNHPENLSFDDLRSFTALKNMLMQFHITNKDYIDAGGFSRTTRAAVAKITYMAGDCHFEKGEKGLAFAAYWEGFTGCPSLRNARVFLWHVLKKSLRLLSFGLISRKRLLKK